MINTGCVICTFFVVEFDRENSSPGKSLKSEFQMHEIPGIFISFANSKMNTENKSSFYCATVLICSV